jgi:dipeptidyl aminopeptidase/acylaminoacyl peptidase
MPLLPENLRKPNRDVALPRISVFLRGYGRLGGRAGLALAINMAGMLAHGASMPSIEDFASRARIEGASISPDGRYLAVIQTLDGRGLVIVDDRQGGKDRVMHPVLNEPDRFLLTWCHWATNTRLLCGLRAITSDRGYLFPVTRLVAVDADGKNMRVLMQNNREAQGQYQDEIINWHPGKPDTVLIEADEGLSANEMVGAQVYGNVGTHGAPAVFELNVVTGQISMRQHAREPIRHWVTDKRGQVRLGAGYSEGTVTFWVHLDGDSSWRRMAKFEVFSRENHFKPIAISAEDPDMAYAIGSSEGRDAIWLIDLKDKDDPKLLFSHPLVDVSHPILARDTRFIGARYDNGYPMMYYADGDIDAMMRGFQKLNPGQFASIVESSLDDKLFLIHSTSDIDASKFWLLDIEAHHVSKIGAAYPDRDTATFASMRPISYAARDGTRIPAYLSTPPTAAGTRPPLIVMPHGGPIARDRWDYFFLRQFLVSRGYAVLQMNFRGSSGYGDDWFFAAHQDWGGLTYDDVVDGARWAVQQDITDRERVCIVGWSFGGYLALVGAQRNPELFHCSVDIAGVSDLPMLISEGRDWIAGTDYRKRQLGTDSEKLKRDSPRLHVADFKVPLLMLHGKKDYQVPFEQSETMDAALTRAGKPHRFVVVPDADHQFSGVKDRATLLKEIEAFLGEHLPAAVPNAPGH